MLTVFFLADKTCSSDGVGYVFCAFFCFRIDLNGFADLLVTLGLINAVNLDGGGSATAVVNGSVVNYPSDTRSGEKPAVCPVNSNALISIHLYIAQDTFFNIFRIFVFER